VTICDLDSLRFVSLRLLWDCNIRCVMCDHPLRPRSEMSVETAHTVLDQLQRPVRVAFIGGEPCLWLLKHPEVLQRTLDEGHVAHVVTNGLLVPELDVLVDAFRNRTISVQFSIDGVGATYEAIRRGSSWPRVIDAIRLLHGQRTSAKNHDAFIVANYVLLRQTLAELPAFVRVCASEGIDTVFVTYGLIYETMVARGTIAHDDSVLFCPDEVEACLTEASRVARETGVPLVLPAPLSDPTATGRRYVGRPRVALPLGRSSVPAVASLACDKPWKEVFVNQDGAIVPCCCGPGMGPVVGHIADGLERVWNGRAIAGVRDALVDGTFHPDCRCGINMSAVGRKESPARFFVSSSG
jgi:MoaA/NifB/PqqE/SkfB family radical SAM enzyme